MAGQAGWHDTSGPYFGGNTGHRRIRRRVAHLALFALLFPFGATGQAQLVVAKPGETLPSFEVAAIREDTSGPTHMSINNDKDIYRAENVTLKDLIMNAWDIRSDAQMRGGPGDLLGKHFDVNARISQDDVARRTKLTPEERSRDTALMLQSMLIDRFGLATHIETKSGPVFALVIAKDGPKFHASASDSSQDGKATHRGEGTWMRVSPKSAELDAHHAGLQALATMIASQSEAEGRMIIDKTGLTGNYDYSMKWTPEWMSARAQQADASPDSDSAGPSLLTALRDQLGLKLVPEKAPIQVLVIDHVEPPTAN